MTNEVAAVAPVLQLCNVCKTRVRALAGFLQSKNILQSQIYKLKILLFYMIKVTILEEKKSVCVKDARQ